ncbi:HD family hydrolase [Kiloniella laminariae]|uniref:HD family hydrolase n=1 Tax=Kiloniella laminariae TaxID=454162 RepID=A0ABT4LII1_9PROT|nr:HD family hydrolase [Kiloniella laminariae]MCZ4280904.1 HD family hydrolase [Kiloniella laminariae]
MSTAKSTPAPRAWQRMLSGRRLDLLDPSPLDVEIQDIALGLSREVRWNGQTTGEWGYSIAEHSLLVEEIVGLLKPDASKEDRLAALLHDAPEYVIGDLITPFKYAIGSSYKELELRLMEAIHVSFGLPANLPERLNKLIKRADRMAAYLEATQLAGFNDREASKIFGKPRSLPNIRITPIPPQKAQETFLKRFRQLY